MRGCKFLFFISFSISTLLVSGQEFTLTSPVVASRADAARKITRIALLSQVATQIASQYDQLFQNSNFYPQGLDPESCDLKLEELVRRGVAIYLNQISLIEMTL